MATMLQWVVVELVRTAVEIFLLPSDTRSLCSAQRVVTYAASGFDHLWPGVEHDLNQDYPVVVEFS